MAMEGVVMVSGVIKGFGLLRIRIFWVLRHLGFLFIMW